MFINDERNVHKDWSHITLSTTEQTTTVTMQDYIIKENKNKTQSQKHHMNNGSIYLDDFSDL